MGHLHALLAVEPDKKGTAEKILAETVNTFQKKQEHFFGQTRKYSPLNEEDEETFAPEIKEIVTTVREKLDYTENPLTDYLDLLYQKEQTNTKAKADLVLEGVTLAKDVPATALLMLENKFKNIRVVYEAIPTLPPEEVWQKDQEKQNQYRTEPKISYRSKKEMKGIILYPATDRHPAQVEKVVEDTRTGTWETIRRSGCLSPLEKSVLLGRVDKVIQAIKTARMKANDQEVDNVKIAKNLFDFINNG